MNRYYNLTLILHSLTCSLFAQLNTNFSDSLIVNNEYSTTSFKYRECKSKAMNFDLIEPGIPIVPVLNGVFAAGLDNWLIQPKDTCYIVSLSSSHYDNSLFILKSEKKYSSVVKYFPKEKKIKPKTILKLLNGVYDIFAYGIDTIYILGSSDNKDFHILRYNSLKLDTLITLDSPITSIFPISSNCVAFSYKNDILLLHNNKLNKLFTNDCLIESITFSDDGGLYFSMSNGVFKIDKSKNIQNITLGIHGMLRSYNKKIYILWQEKSQIVMLDRK
jgi:hypothetical protein